jgi:histidine kinase
MSPASAHDLDTLLARRMFELVPFSVAVIDRDFRVVAANSNFEEYFGEWRGRSCHEAYKRSRRRCPHCQARATFEDGLVRVSDETGIDRHGRPCHYVVHIAPLRSGNGDGDVEYIIEMTTDLTETRRWQREYDLLFERVPCYALVIDRNLRVTRANERFREMFGDAEGRYCYEAWKRRKGPCRNCPAELTFRDGAEHVADQVGVHRDGSPAYYVATTAPLSRGEPGVVHVIETATDITPVRRLERDLRAARDFYESLIRNSATAILAVDGHGQPRIMNPAAHALLAWHPRRLPSPDRLEQMLPPEFFAPGAAGEEGLDRSESVAHTATGEEVPVRFSTVDLRSHGTSLGRAAFLDDLRELKRLEQGKLEAERLGAVGQTVAGLAHTIKNLLMGLEGGMYMLDTGLRKGEADRIVDGWQVLERNFQKTTTLVKDFLDFAKGRLPELRPADPVAVARGVVDLYRSAAARQGVELALETDGEVREAPLDVAGIETCLTNLVSNGIDAALLRERPGARVTVRAREDDDDLVFEVVDNGCGMDQEVKSKVFTTFFTTKGGKGTGLGLLTTRKIVQEHGGRMEMDSVADRGSTFRIRLPRKRLEALAGAAQKAPSG